MKLTFQWKDPDAALIDIEGDIPDKERLIRRGDEHRLPDEIRKTLRKIGFDEYLVVEFDLDTMTGTVKK